MRPIGIGNRHPVHRQRRVPTAGPCRVSNRGLRVHGQHLQPCRRRPARPASSARSDRSRRCRGPRSGRRCRSPDRWRRPRGRIGPGLSAARAVAAPLGRHLEDVAVGLLEPVGGTRLDQRLLAGEPRPPRRRPARAVARGAAQAGPRLHERARRGVELHRRRAAAGPRVVGRARRRTRPGRRRSRDCGSAGRGRPAPQTPPSRRALPA